MANCPPEPPCVLPPLDDSCEKARTCAPISFDAGNYKVAYDGKCLTKSRRGNALADGWYEAVRIEDGVIVEAREFSGKQVVIENPCSNSSTGTTGSVTVSADSCNLTALDSRGALLSRFSYLNGPYLQISGCGSMSSPLDVQLDFDSVKTDVLAGGLNFSGCGIEIANGLVTSFVTPITTIKSNNPALQITVDGCVATLNVASMAGSVVYMRPWCGGTDGSMKGFGVVFRGAGNTANVSVKANNASDQGSAPVPPSSFSSVQEAINWVDANLPSC